jgi:hypothetical protein
MDKVVYPRLPPVRLANARVLTDRYDLMQVLPKGVVFAAIGAGAAALGGDMRDICTPRHWLAIGPGAELAAESLDIAWLDSDRAYEVVRRDLALIGNWVRPDGWIVVSGYAAEGDLIRAAHEFIVEQDYEMLFLALGPAFCCDIALRRIGVARSLRSIQEENAALQDALRGMRDSAVWRATAPLRAFATFIRGT